MTRKYALLLGGLLVVILSITGLAQLYLSYRIDQATLLELQSEKGAAAALSVRQTVGEIEAQLPQLPADELCQENNGPGIGFPQGCATTVYATQAQRVQAYEDLLALLPEVTEISYIDASGIQRTHVVRSGAQFDTTTDLGLDRRKDPAFFKPNFNQPYRSPVSVHGGVLQMTFGVVAFLGTRGVIVAEVNLGFVSQALKRIIKIPERGWAFVVDSLGNVIADTRRSVAQLTSTAQLEQVHNALAPSSPTRGAMVAAGPSGTQVLSGYAKADPPGWVVFVEQPISVAFAPLNALALRLAALVAAALLVALVAAVLLARRMVHPIAVLRTGAMRVAAGDLTQPIELRTGDDFEVLADEFNRMTRRLRESTEGLEQRVRDQTQELAAALEEVEQKSRQLEAASRHKSEFLANMSHELRTPLNAIIGFSEVLRERIYGELNPRQKDYLDDIHSSGLHLLALINDILDLSKLEAGRMELQLSEFSLAEALSDAVRTVHEPAHQGGLELETRIDPALGPGLVEADERKIRQSVSNLLTNAVKFTPAGGRVLLSARLRDGLAEVAVRDTGIGIAEEDQTRIFDGFQQVSPGGLRQGTGLGLTLARKFIELHGGRIWVESHSGEGSTFTFTLPVARPEPGVANYSEVPGGAGRSG
jgi:signal transduction histidine kinase